MSGNQRGTRGSIKVLNTLRSDENQLLFRNKVQRIVGLFHAPLFDVHILLTLKINKIRMHNNYLTIISIFSNQPAQLVIAKKVKFKEDIYK